MAAKGCEVVCGGCKVVWNGFEMVLVARWLRSGSKWFSAVVPEEGRKGRKGGREKGRKGGGRREGDLGSIPISTNP